MSPHQGSISAEQEESAKAVGKIYRGGYTPYDISACMGCHGPSGSGIPPRLPRVSGQSATYIKNQLKDFKAGFRKDEIMFSIAFALSEQQIRDLALDMSALD